MGETEASDDGIWEDLRYEQKQKQFSGFVSKVNCKKLKQVSAMLHLEQKQRSSGKMLGLNMDALLRDRSSVTQERNGSEEQDKTGEDQPNYQDLPEPEPNWEEIERTIQFSNDQTIQLIAVLQDISIINMNDFELTYKINSFAHSIQKYAKRILFYKNTGCRCIFRKILYSEEYDDFKNGKIIKEENEFVLFPDFERIFTGES